MVMSIEEISDRFEINDLLVRYCTAVDTGNFDLFDDIFTLDAIIDYTEMGGKSGNLEEIKQFLKETLPRFQSHQHMIANSVVEIDGDNATTRTICQNPMVIEKTEGETHVFFCGLWYVDKLIRTPVGWRIKERREERSYFHNLPKDFEFPT